jgi:hypothetical protein
MGGACNPVREGRVLYRVMVGEPEEKRPRHRWKNNIKMYLQEVGYGCTDWIELAKDRHKCRAIVNAVMNVRVPKNVGNFLTSCKPVSFSIRTLLHGVG